MITPQRQKPAQARWQRDIAPGNPIFNDLRTCYAERLHRQWPDCKAFNALAAKHLKDKKDLSIPHFAPQEMTLAALDYERFIHREWTVPMRPQSWHDAFNAFMWLSFPRIKRALNMIHVTDPCTSGKRSRRRDFATLLDETGMLIACNNDTARELNRNHRWRELFIHHKPLWWQNWRPFIIGHGLYEQSLTPYVGLTAKAFYWPVENDFFNASLENQQQQLDMAISAWLSRDQPLSSRLLFPLPLLGVPGWWAANRDPAFYDNRDYFRPTGKRPI